MALEMRGHCEKCETDLSWGGEAYICSYECTFCQPCSGGMAFVCPKCGGELRRRPTRKEQ